MKFWPIGEYFTPSISHSSNETLYVNVNLSPTVKLRPLTVNVRVFSSNSTTYPFDLEVELIPVYFKPNGSTSLIVILYAIPFPLFVITIE